MCVKSHTVQVTWQNARTRCQQEHGDLVVHDMAANNDFVRRHVVPGRCESN